MLLLAPRGSFASANVSTSLGNFTKMQRLCPKQDGGVLRIWQNANTPCAYAVSRDVVAPLNELMVVPEGCTADPYTFPKCAALYSESSWPHCNVTIPETLDNASQSFWMALNLLTGLITFPVLMNRIYMFRQAKKTLTLASFCKEKLVQQWVLGGWFAFSFILSGIDPDGRNGLIPKRFATKFIVESRTVAMGMFVSK